MPGHGCKKKKGKKPRKHTPIVSRQQQKLFGRELSIREKGGKGKMPGITTAELRRHLKESKGKKLPKRTKKGRKR